jgi:hypothetical protein
MTLKNGDAYEAWVDEERSYSTMSIWGTAALVGKLSRVMSAKENTQ